jgi:hypothetical protein
MAHHDATHASPDDEYLNPEATDAHEHTDANVWMIVQFAIWLVASAIIVHLLMWGMFDWFVASRDKAQPRLEYPMANDPGLRLPAEPRLQRFPATDLYDFRLRERAELDSYGYIDRNAGTVHIPIEEAMRLTVERGLPSRAQEPAADGTAPTTPGMMPADSSSGRTLERRR